MKKQRKQQEHFGPKFTREHHDARESVHRDTTMKITNKMHYID